MKKALIVSTVSRQFTLFERGNIGILNGLGYEVHCAANYSDATEKLDELEIIRHQIDIERSPFSINQIKAYKQLTDLMEREGFDLIHCHAPMGGVVGRLAAKKTKAKNVLYTAHGFHFYEGASKLKNLIYKSVEKFCAKYTDKLITMNEEDFRAAKTFKLKNGGKVFKIPGVGVDLKQIENTPKINKKRCEIGIPEEAFIILSVGELIERKNYIMAIQCLEKLIKENKNVYYVICGRGVLEENLKKECEARGISENVKFLGFRNDIYEIMKISDLFLFPSFQEGLPKALMEAMASGLVPVVSKIRGNVDLIQDNKNGFIFELDNKEELLEKLNYVIKNRNIKSEIIDFNKDFIKEYGVKNNIKIMSKIYTA